MEMKKPSTLNVDNDDLSEEEIFEKRKYYWELAKLCRTDEQKIKFFDENKEALFMDPDTGE